MCISTEGLQNNALLNDKKIIFLMNIKQKDAEAAAHFHIKAAKIAQVIIILRKFVQEDLISVISFLLDRVSARSLVFGPYTILPLPLCQHATFIYCAKYVNINTGKSFVGTRRGGEDMP